MSLRNKKDFREAVLQALDVNDDKDVENEYNFKSAVLEAMGVEFVPADLRDFEIYRAKLVEGIGNMSSGGGGSSDFSTAEVAIMVDAGLSDGGGLNGGIANLSEGYGFLKNSSIVTMAGASAGETINVTAILIEGEAIYSIIGGVVGNTTGGVSYDPENDTVKVIGDGSITITFGQ